MKKATSDKPEPTAKRYRIVHLATDYTFPQQPTIHDVRFDDAYIHVDLTAGRILSRPLGWSPTVHNAPAEDRRKFEISRSRTRISWDPDKGASNDELRREEYLGPCQE